MATVNKEIADRIVAGEFSEDRAVKIVKYINMAGEDAYGVIFEGDPLDKYEPSPFVHSPSVYWEAPK